MSIRHAVDPIEAIHGVLALIAQEIDHRTPICCAACGCLCRPSEICPSCHPEAYR